MREILRRSAAVLRKREEWMEALHIWGPALVLFAAVILRVFAYDEVEGFQHKVFDAFQRLRPRPYVAAPVRVLDLDDASLERLGQWPWPRNLLADMLDRLNAFGVGIVAFDSVFAEPDRTSPKQVARYWPASPGLDKVRPALGGLPDHDALFAGSIAAGGNVVLGFGFTGEVNAKRPAQKHRGFIWLGPEAPEFLFQGYNGAVVNLPVLEEAAAGNGSFSIQNESDGFVRRVPLVFSMGGKLYPSLVAEVFRVAAGAPGYKIKTAGGSGEAAFGEVETGIVKVQVGDRVVPTDANGRVWVHYTDPVLSRTIPVWKVFDPGFDGKGLEGAIVFLGTSAQGLKDQRATPLNPILPGVEVHAQLAEQIIHEHYLTRPDWADGVEFLYMLLLGGLLIFLLTRIGALWCFGLLLAAVAAVFALSLHAFTSWRLLLDPVFPTLVVVLVYIVSSLISYLRSEAERAQVTGAFSRYMSPHLVAQLAQNPEKLKLGGEMRDMTLLFCDVRGFTTISEQFSPEGLTHLINRFLTPMTDIILQREGTIDKYMGDCIMAFWNAPLDDKKHVAHACESALAMMARLKPLNEELEAWAKAEERKHVPINIGIGLNTGDCCVGNMGSDQRFDYSVLGDDVNLASRLEGQSKGYGVDIVVGPETRWRAGKFAFIELDLIKVKGKNEAVRIYALLGGPEVEASPEFKTLAKTHAAMLKAYRKQEWETVEGLIARLRELPFALSKLYDLYAQRVHQYRENPPGPEWDGVFTATTK